MKSIVRIPGLAAGLVLAGALASSAAPDPGHAGTSFRGNPEHTGVYASPALRLPWQVRWRWKTGGRVRSSPAVAAGRVYVGSMDGRLYALDAATGKLAWKYDTEGTTLNAAKFRYDRTSVQSSPAVAGGLVVFGCRDGFLYAL